MTPALQRCIASQLRQGRLWTGGIAQTRSHRTNVQQQVQSAASARATVPSSQQLPRFYVQQPLAGAGPGQLVKLAEEEARHATKTLRLQEGDCIELCDGRGAVAVAEIEGLEQRRGALVRLVDAAARVPLEGWQWEAAVACGSLKGGRSDWLVEKLTELGAAALLPLRTERSPLIGSEDSAAAPSSGRGSRDSRSSSGSTKRQRRGQQQQQEEDAESGAENGSGREGRWARVATAAMKQCLRAHRMQVLPACDIAELCARIATTNLALVGVAGAPPLHAVLPARLPASTDKRPSAGGAPRQGLLIVGPEGDFTPAELEAMLAAGAQPVGLGPLRLRAETAAIAMMAYLQLHFGSEK